MFQNNNYVFFVLIIHLVQCPAGHFYNSANLLCEECGIGKYQSNPGRSSCNSCNKGYTTKSTTSTSSSDCVVTCGNGEELNDKGECVPCEVGKYRVASVSNDCVKCDKPYTTKTTGAKSKAECSRIVCEAGRYRQGDNPGVCIECAIGSYSISGSDSCTLCGDLSQWTTKNKGSKSKADCLCEKMKKFNYLSNIQ